MIRGDEQAEGIGGSGWSSELEVRQLRALLALVEHGSVSRAALALGLAQSTVSEALASLDRAVGTPTILRKRGAHRIALTPAGEVLLPHARRVLQQLDAAHLAIAVVTRRARARVEVIANESVSTYLLPAALGTLRMQWPNTTFAVSVGTCAGVRAGLAEGRYDLGLLLEEDSSANAACGPSVGPAEGASTRLMVKPDIPLVVFAGLKHPLVLGGPHAVLQRGALAPFPMFVSDAAGDFHELLKGYFEDNGLQGPRLEPAGSIEGVKRGVAAEASALGVLPLYAVSEDLENGRSYALALNPDPPRMRLVALLAPPQGARHPAIAQLLDQLRGPDHP